MYTNSESYEKMYIRKINNRQVKKHGKEKIKDYILQKEKPKKTSKGTVTDVVKSWKHYYNFKGWERYAKFNNKGGFNEPYILFKSKNVIDPKIRQEKWHVVRPIAPATKHPMKNLLGKFHAESMPVLGLAQYCLAVLGLAQYQWPR